MYEWSSTEFQNPRRSSEHRNMLVHGWSGLGCLIQCINSIIWNKNMVNRAPVYCDIVTRIQVGLNAAIPASSLCINRRLYKISTVQTSMATRRETPVCCVGTALQHLRGFRAHPPYSAEDTLYTSLLGMAHCDWLCVSRLLRQDHLSSLQASASAQ
ncbi:pheromone A receptor-domain-containing protein [Lactifluus subvellereus]|nr:pheromone A receptor-domain-containing protein [Lactifluus subvellereus]